MGLPEGLKIKDYKAVGYGLLIAGLIMIIYSVYSMYNVYTGAAPPPSVIQIDSVALPNPAGGSTPASQIELISGSESSKLINMGLWFMLMAFIASGGGRIGGLGTKLIREIKVEVKGED